MSEKKKFISQAIKHPGSFRSYCQRHGLLSNGKVKSRCINQGLKSHNPTIHKRAVLARTLARLPRHHGPKRGKGRVKPIYSGGAWQKGRYHGPYAPGQGAINRSLAQYGLPGGYVGKGRFTTMPVKHKAMGRRKRGGFILPALGLLAAHKLYKTLRGQGKRRLHKGGSKRIGDPRDKKMFGSILGTGKQPMPSKKFMYEELKEHGLLNPHPHEGRGINMSRSGVQFGGGRVHTGMPKRRQGRGWADQIAYALFH